MWPVFQLASRPLEELSKVIEIVERTRWESLER
jgi:hypothetical protein